MSPISIFTSDDLGPLRESTIAALNALNRFYHRHKNQHRVARWWADLSLLRRSLGRLCNALDAYDNHATLTRKLSASRRKQSQESTSTSARLQAAATQRARWLVECTLPKAYIAFTQLAADQQHAALGLFLIGMTGFLSNSLAFLLPPMERSHAQAPLGTDSAVSLPSRKASAGSPSGEMDTGIVVPRSSLGMAHTTKLGSQSTGTASSSVTWAREEAPLESDLEAKAPIPSHSKQSQKGARIPDARSRKPKVAKKRKKEDEFASLFGSLI